MPQFSKKEIVVVQKAEIENLIYNKNSNKKENGSVGNGYNLTFLICSSLSHFNTCHVYYKCIRIFSFNFTKKPS